MYRSCHRGIMRFFFYDPAATEIYTLSLHDALPISQPQFGGRGLLRHGGPRAPPAGRRGLPRSEEHTSELQSQSNLVCRLLLEKKKNPTSRIDGNNSIPIAALIPAVHHQPNRGSRSR